LNYGSGTFTCDTAGYSGSISYNCSSQNTPNLGGSCVPTTCSIPAGTGYSAKVVNVGQSSFNCDAAGYTGNISYNCSCASSSTISLASNTSYYTNYSCQDIVLHTFAQNSTLTNVSVSYSARDQGWGNDCSYGHFLVHDFVSWLFYSPIDIPQSSSHQYRSYNWTPNVSVSAGSRVEINVCSPYPGCQAYVQGFNASITFSSQGGGSCSSPIVTTSGTCTPITCSIGAGTGYSGRTLNYGSGSFTCDTAGYTGTISYNCNAMNNPNLSGSCTPITCSIGAGTGYSGRTLNYGSGSFTCNTAGYTGTISYNCNAMNNPNLSGSCTASGSFTPNWYAWTSVGCGSYAYDLSNNSVGVMGAEGCGAQWSYYFTYLPSWATRVSFDFQYCINDWNAYYDPGRLYVNNTWYDVFTSGGGYGSCHYGTWTNFPVQGGTAFGPGIYSIDGCCGRGQLKFYNIVVQ